VVRSELGQRQLSVVRMVVRWWWACLLVGVALGQEGGLPPPTRQRPRPNNGGFSSFLSGFLSSVTQTADVSDCPGKCIHAIASLICDQVLEHVSCPAKNMRCCVEAEFQKNKGEGGAPPLPLDAEDKIGIADITERSTTTTEITTTTKRKKKRRRKTTTKATTPATTTTTTTTVTTTRKPTTQTTEDPSLNEDYEDENPDYEYTSPANTSDSSRLTLHISTISLLMTLLTFLQHQNH